VSVNTPLPAVFCRWRFCLLEKNKKGRQRFAFFYRYYFKKARW